MRHALQKREKAWKRKRANKKQANAARSIEHDR